MTDRMIALIAADGRVADQCFVSPGMTAEALGMNPAGLVEVEVTRFGDLAGEQFDPLTGLWSPLLDAHRERLLVQVEAGRRAAGEATLSEGRSVQYAYREKAAELRAWDATAPEARVSADYPWLSAEATATGETIEAVADRVRSAKVLADAALRTVEAKAQAAKIAIRAATTLEDMQAAAAVNWEN